jgi:hypothetical protein
VTPAGISRVSMFPPCASGTSEDRVSNAAGGDTHRAVHRIEGRVAV